MLDGSRSLVRCSCLAFSGCDVIWLPLRLPAPVDYTLERLGVYSLDSHGIGRLSDKTHSVIGARSDYSRWRDRTPTFETDQNTPKPHVSVPFTRKEKRYGETKRYCGAFSTAPGAPIRCLGSDVAIVQYPL
jgi:hypothetical protein